MFAGDCVPVFSVDASRPRGPPLDALKAPAYFGWGGPGWGGQLSARGVAAHTHDGACKNATQEHCGDAASVGRGAWEARSAPSFSFG